MYKNVLFRDTLSNDCNTNDKRHNRIIPKRGKWVDFTMRGK